MLDRIQEGVTERDRVLASQRMFTANAAHELRTPLTTMRTAIDVTLDSQPGTEELLTMTGDVRTAVEQSQRTIDGLLTLARSQTGTGHRHRVDLADLVGSSLDGGTLTMRADLLPAPVRGEPVLLERMCGNLVDNAVRHNHAGGHIEIATGTTGGRAFLRIRNSGPRIAAERPSTSCGSRSSAATAHGSTPTGAPVSACPSWTPWSPLTGARWSSPPGPQAGWTSPSTCPLRHRSPSSTSRLTVALMRGCRPCSTSRTSSSAISSTSGPGGVVRFR
jgi:light-regulated signal transduction histidine kinase (bacteriophytochrome)